MARYTQTWKKYCVFIGRADRREFFTFVLLNTCLLLVAMALDNLFDIAFRKGGYGPVAIVTAAAMFLPTFTLSVRRLHDIGKSGWLIFIGLVPIAGQIYLLILFLRKSQRESNRFGVNPQRRERQTVGRYYGM